MGYVYLCSLQSKGTEVLVGTKDGIKILCMNKKQASLPYSHILQGK